VARKGRKKGASLNRGIFLVAGFVFGFIVAFGVLKYAPIKGPAPVRPLPAEKAAPSGEKIPAPGTVGPRPPRVAILIDDMGGSLKRLRELLELDAPITIAVLPHLRHSREVSRIAGMSGRDVLLHLPMEPKNSSANHPGPGVLLTSMADETIRKTVEDDLGFVPEAVGVNNHMGSRFTEDEPAMRQVFAILGERGLFFVDSRTTARSLGRKLARETGVMGAERDVFLDNRRDGGYIDGQFRTLVHIATKTGSAIAIGHPYPETMAALRRAMPEMKREGIEVVPVSDLVR